MPSQLSFSISRNKGVARLYGVFNTSLSAAELEPELTEDVVDRVYLEYSSYSSAVGLQPQVRPAMLILTNNKVHL